jgi:hypothetical protein
MVAARTFATWWAWRREKNDDLVAALSPISDYECVRGHRAKRARDVMMVVSLVCCPRLPPPPPPPPPPQGPT